MGPLLNLIYAQNNMYLPICDDHSDLTNIYCYFLLYFQCHTEKYNREEFPRGICRKEIGEWQFDQYGSWFVTSFCLGCRPTFPEVSFKYFWSPLQAHGVFFYPFYLHAHYRVIFDLYSWLTGEENHGRKSANGNGRYMKCFFSLSRGGKMGGLFQNVSFCMVWVRLTPSSSSPKF